MVAVQRLMGIDKTPSIHFGDVSGEELVITPGTPCLLFQFRRVSTRTYSHRFINAAALKGVNNA